MKIFKALAITFSRALAAVGLISFALTSFAATTTRIATISSATTDGSASSSTFQLSVTSGQLANALTTSSDIELSLALAPQASHRGLKASVYTVIVAGGKFFKLTEDGSYGPWNGTVEDLTPFATNQTLESANRFSLLNGKMAEAGSYLYFVAYGVEGESRLLFTPDPAQITVTESDVLPDDTTSVAAETFEAELESAVVQAKCILCHVEGGLARNSSLQFQRTNTASALGRENVMITPHPAYQKLGDTQEARAYAYRKSFEEEPEGVDRSAIDEEIRSATKQGVLVAGTTFAADVARRLNCEVTAKPRGRPKKTGA